MLETSSEMRYAPAPPNEPAELQTRPQAVRRLAPTQRESPGQGHRASCIMVIDADFSALAPAQLEVSR